MLGASTAGARPAFPGHGSGFPLVSQFWDNREKPIVWLGDSLARVREFPVGARREAGYRLERVQDAREPVDWKPMLSVGRGVNEIRVRAGGAFRVLYVARYAEAVYVLHAFGKRSRKTARLDVELARERFRALVRERAGL